MFTLRIAFPKQTVFTVKTDCENLLNLLRLKYGHYVSSLDYRDENTIIATKSGVKYKVLFNDERYYTEYCMKQIDDIMYEYGQYDDSVYAIHGGAVEYNGGAYLIIASTTSGKSTLTSYLTSSGCGYITDDCILLDRESFMVCPFTTPIHLREGGYNVLKGIGCAPENIVFLDDIYIKRYVYTPPNLVNGSVPIKKIFFITRTENENCVLSMNATERMIELLKSPIKEYKLDAGHIGFISELAKTPCERLYYKDMNFVLEVIKNG